MEHLYDGLSDIKGITLYGAAVKNSGPVLSLNIEGMKPGDVAYILQNGYDITVRTGLHCAPLIHKAMGTYPDGTVRISVSDFNTIEDINSVLEAFKDIASGLNYENN